MKKKKQKLARGNFGIAKKEDKNCLKDSNFQVIGLELFLIISTICC